MMQSRDFCFWLQGFFELSGEVTAISVEQSAMIRRHLDMVFHHEIVPQTPGVQARERSVPTSVPPFPTAPPEPKRDPVREPNEPQQPCPRPPQPPLC
jgi:hypothetical protein